MIMMFSQEICATFNEKVHKLTNKSGGSTTGSSTFTGSGGGANGWCSFLYSIAKISLGAAILSSATCSSKDYIVENKYCKI